VDGKRARKTLKSGDAEVEGNDRSPAEGGSTEEVEKKKKDFANLGKITSNTKYAGPCPFERDRGSFVVKGTAMEKKSSEPCGRRSREKRGEQGATKNTNGGEKRDTKGISKIYRGGRPAQANGKDRKKKKGGKESKGGAGSA